MANNISPKNLKNFNIYFCKEHCMSNKDIEKAKRIFKKEYEHDLEMFKKGKLKIGFFKKYF